MNPMVRSYLDQIRASLGELETAVAEHQNTLKSERDSRDEALQRYWHETKEKAVLQQGQKEYEALAVENERLKAAHSEVREHLGRLLDYAKALGTELRQ